MVKTVNGFTKVFIGEIIERARDVQAQWEAAAAAVAAANAAIPEPDHPTTDVATASNPATTITATTNNTTNGATSHNDIPTASNATKHNIPLPSTSLIQTNNPITTTNGVTPTPHIPIPGFTQQGTTNPTPLPPPTSTISTASNPPISHEVVPTLQLGIPPNLVVKEPRPLQPDHIREALRRYKKDKEGGGAGLKMLSLGGMVGYSPATGGKRLFR